MSRITAARAAPALLVLVVLASAPFSFARFFGLDEGLYYYEARLLARGDVIYRDFFEFVGPGVLLFVRAFYALFGERVGPVRIGLLVLYLAEVLLIYDLGRRVVRSRALALVPPLLYALWAKLDGWQAIDHYSLSHVTVLLTGAALVRWVERPRLAWPLVAGLSAGATLCTTQNLGLLALAMGAFWIVVRQRWEDGRGRLAPAAVFLAAAAAPVILVLGWLAAEGALAAAYECMVRWVLRRYRTFHGEPYFYQGRLALADLLARPSGPALQEALRLALVGYVPPLALAWGFARLLWLALARRRAGDPAAMAAYGIAWSAAAIQFATALGQPTYWKIMRNSALTYAFALEPLVLLLGRRPERGAPGGPRLATSALAAALHLALATGYYDEIRTALAMKPRRVHLHAPQGTFWSTDAELIRDVEAVISRVADRTSPADAIFVYHWSPHLYLLADRKAPVRFSGTLPGYHDPAQVDEMVAAVRARRPALIVEDRVATALFDVKDYRMQFHGRRNLRRDPLRLAVREEYEPLLWLKHFTVYRPRTGPPAPAAGRMLD